MGRRTYVPHSTGRILPSTVLLGTSGLVSYLFLSSSLVSPHDLLVIDTVRFGDDTRVRSSLPTDCQTSCEHLSGSIVSSGVRRRRCLRRWLIVNRHSFPDRCNISSGFRFLFFTNEPPKLSPLRFIFTCGVGLFARRRYLILFFAAVADAPLIHSFPIHHHLPNSNSNSNRNRNSLPHSVSLLVSRQRPLLIQQPCISFLFFFSSPSSSAGTILHRSIQPSRRLDLSHCLPTCCIPLFYSFCFLPIPISCIPESCSHFVFVVLVD